MTFNDVIKTIDDLILVEQNRYKRRGIFSALPRAEALADLRDELLNKESYEHYLMNRQK